MITASIVGANFVTLMIDGATTTVNSDHLNYTAIREALRDKNFDVVERLINVTATITKFGLGKVTVVNGEIFYGSEQVHGSVVTRILSMIREGFDANPLIKFLENLMSNPSHRAVNELYGFLEATALPITEDGHFLAYKKVANDYLDFYTHKIDNSVGKVVEMVRHGVDEDKDRTCSSGLHFCSLSYLPAYHGGAGRVMIVKINPADVVAIPSDYNNAKGRTCRYEVVGEHTLTEREEAFTSSVYSNATPAMPPASKTSNTVAMGDPSEDGYQAGRVDATAGTSATEVPDYYSVADKLSWSYGYNRGVNSVLRNSIPLVDPAVDYNNGFIDGKNEGQGDSENLYEYDDVPIRLRTADYNAGFRAGYAEGYEIDWENVGYEAGVEDVKDDSTYDDCAPDICEDDADYAVGYAKGWCAAKIALLD